MEKIVIKDLQYGVECTMKHRSYRTAQNDTVKHVFS